MGILSRLLPWKRKDELGLKDNLALGGFGQPGGPDNGFGGLGFNSSFPGGPVGPGMPQSQLGQQQFGGMGNMGSMGGMMQSQPVEAFDNNRAYERSYAAGKDIEVVSAKLDAIKAALETLNQRLASIERYIQTDQDFKKRGW